MPRSCRVTAALSPIQAAILAGDSETGVTIMQVDEGLDTGDILLKVATPIGSDETAGSLHDRLALLAPAALLDSLDLLERGVAHPQPQDPALATYAPKLTPWRRGNRLEQTCRRNRKTDPRDDSVARRLHLFAPAEREHAF